MTAAHAMTMSRRALLRGASAISGLWAGASLGANAAGSAGPADLLLRDGKFLRFEAPPAQALAIRAGRIVALGGLQDVDPWVNSATRVLSLGGRTVIPGLIDSHIHAIRAGLTYGREVDWSGTRSIPEALERLRTAARTQAPGSWLIVAGGWIETQFRERRRPRLDEVQAAVPGFRVYLQRLYTAVLLDEAARISLDLPRRAELASRLTPEVDDQGRSTGWLQGDARTISEVYELLPPPSMAQQRAGTRDFLSHLNSLGVTGVIDPGGYNLPLSAYRALFDLWRHEGLSLRVDYSVCAPRRDRELEDFQRLQSLLPIDSGDTTLHFNGIGENVVWTMYNNDTPSAAARERLRQVLAWAASRALGVTLHWNNERSVDHLLTVIEQVAATHDIRRLRWSIAHLNDASARSLQRMKALGLGWLVQNALYFRAEELQHRHGDAVASWPRLRQAIELGIPVGMGTDAHRVMSCHPFVALQWLLDGRSAGGARTRRDGDLLDRLEALRLYTQGSAWFAHDEHQRGSLAPGLRADLAVLSGDYATIPVGAVGELRAELTLLGGKVVHASGDFEGIPRDSLR